MDRARKTGLVVPERVPWGTHFCQFYETKDDLLEVLVPYFKEGLEANEACIWITYDPISVEEAKEALRSSVAQLDGYLSSGQLELIPHNQWYLKDGSFDMDAVLRAWCQKAEIALGRGYCGLRVTGNAACLQERHEAELVAYEEKVQASLSSQKIVALCSYPLNKCTASQFLQAFNSHDCALVRRQGGWECIEPKGGKQILDRLHIHQHAVNSSVTPLAMTDLAGRMTYANPAALKAWGYEDEREVLDRPVVDFWKDPQEITAYLERVQTSGSCIGQLVAKRKDGSNFDVELLGSLTRDDRGQPLGLVASCLDVTERNRTQRELHIAKQAAEAASRAKSEFLANMSHEIRTPMTAILGFADILSQDPQAEEAVEATQIIQRNGRHLLNLINDILDLSKIEAGKCTVSLQKCSPGQIAEEVIALMKVRADAKALPLVLTIRQGVPDEITTDPIRLRQILVNLVGNAVKFTEVGGVRVDVRPDSGPDGAVGLRFDVIDTGVGISLDQMGLLFQPFSQLDSSTRRRFSGTGLGLAISKRLAGILGGDILVQSKPGQGSIFSLVLNLGPASQPALPHTPATKKMASCPATEAGDAPLGLKTRVLLAEDNEFNRRLIVLTLEKSGADVTVVENGQTAVQCALAAQKEGKPFDAIFMDMMMPVMDGYEATRRLRLEGYDGPIIALTANVMEGDREKCLNAGCDDYLGKPIDRPALIETLAKYARAGSPGAACADTVEAGATR